MIRKLLLTIFLLKTSLIFAQVDFTQVYYPIINDAEMTLIDSNYVEALDLYKGAFQNVEKPFAKDFYNASLCAFYADRQNMMFEYLEKLAEKGLPYDSLKKDIFYKLVIDTTTKWKKFEVRYRNVKPLINKDLRDSLERMNMHLVAFFKKERNAVMYNYFAPNQRDRKRFDSLANRLLSDKSVPMKIIFAKTFLDTLGKDSLIFAKIKKNNAVLDSAAKVNGKTINQIQDENYHNLLKIIDEYGFPDENLVGISSLSLENTSVLNILENGDYQFWYKDASISRRSSLPDILSKNKQESIEIIFQAVRQGKMLPRTAQILLRNRLKDDYFHSGKIQVFKIKLENNLTCNEAIFEGKKDKWLWKKEEFGDFTIAQINERRAKIGLESLDNCYKKLFYKQKMPFFEINSGWFTKEYTYASSCSIVEKLIKNTVVVENQP